ncbi:MAG TPA: hypothetical protein VE709_07065 [Pseudonocardiaceae bacterium]|nr:hypothetical protein [Pseudonocardiaceae bacterium]
MPRITELRGARDDYAAKREEEARERATPPRRRDRTMPPPGRELVDRLARDELGQSPS